VNPLKPLSNGLTTAEIPANRMDACEGKMNVRRKLTQDGIKICAADVRITLPELVPYDPVIHLVLL
jgi:hypothetical protein